MAPDDEDWLHTCPDCPHPFWEHDILEGCKALDDRGNRCACERGPA